MPWPSPCRDHEIRTARKTGSVYSFKAILPYQLNNPNPSKNTAHWTNRVSNKNKRSKCKYVGKLKIATPKEPPQPITNHHQPHLNQQVQVRDIVMRLNPSKIKIKMQVSIICCIVVGPILAQAPQESGVSPCTGDGEKTRPSLGTWNDPLASRGTSLDPETASQRSEVWHERPPPRDGEPEKLQLRGVVFQNLWAIHVLT